MIEAKAWRPTDGLVLEPNALIAAREVRESIVLTAGPGAGKTEVLAQRVDFVLTTGTCPYPKRVLAISAKVDACANLATRARSRSGHQLARRLDSQTFHSFAKRLIDQFRVVLVGQDALDPTYSVGSKRVYRSQIRYADMIPLATKIVSSNARVRTAIRQTYTHLLLDEFQDCTGPQYDLIKSCFLGSETQLTAVGDTKQRIMGFAGALEGILQTLAEDFSARSLNLYQNRRSAPRIRRLQNAMVKRMDPSAAAPDEEISGDEGKVSVARFDSDVDEASYVREEIGKWINQEGVPASEIAVLVAKQPELYTVTLAAELTASGIPFRHENAMQDLAAEPLFRLICDFLRITFGQNEPESYSRLMTTLMTRDLDEEEESRLVEAWNAYFTRARRYAKRNEGVANSEVVRVLANDLLKRVGRDFARTLSVHYEHGNFVVDVRDRTIARVLEVASIAGSMGDALHHLAADDSVKILTVHKSKGLEFHSVIVVGVENELYWPEKIDDERAAYFVAISRAKQRLVLTTSQYRVKPSGADWRWREQRTPQVEFLAYAENC